MNTLSKRKQDCLGNGELTDEQTDNLSEYNRSQQEQDCFSNGELTNKQTDS